MPAVEATADARTDTVMALPDDAARLAYIEAEIANPTLEWSPGSLVTAKLVLQALESAKIHDPAVVRGYLARALASDPDSHRAVLEELSGLSGTAIAPAPAVLPEPRVTHPARDPAAERMLAGGAALVLGAVPLGVGVGYASSVWCPPAREGWCPLIYGGSTVVVAGLTGLTLVGVGAAELAADARITGFGVTPNGLIVSGVF
jgi:hypothetical protein